MYGKEIVVADREMVESQADLFLNQAATEDVAFLVVGDPFGYYRYIYIYGISLFLEQLHILICS